MYILKERAVFSKLPLQIINMTENPLEYQSFMSNAPFSTPLSR
jgi:hypothetical protein